MALPFCSSTRTFFILKKKFPHEKCEHRSRKENFSSQEEGFSTSRDTYRKCNFFFVSSADLGNLGCYEKVEVTIVKKGFCKKST